MLVGDAIGEFGCFSRRAFATVLILLALPVAPVQAATSVCRQLEAELARLPSGGGGSSAQARRYDRAITRQQEQMRTAREQGRQAGCGRAIFGRAVAFCGSLAATMARMESNLAELQRQRSRLGGRDTRRERVRIQRALDAERCRAPQRTLPAPVEETATARPAIDGRTGLRVSPPVNTRLYGNYRTLCVRTCDGYYFPVSWSVSQSAFERDQNACQAMCPGTRTELHYHHTTGEESEDMISTVTGLPYREMTNAFRYRQSSTPPPGCGCEASAESERGFTVIGGDHGNGLPATNAEEAPPTAAIPQPSLRPDLAEDPETLKQMAVPARRPPPAGGERTVRVVGPTFLPDPEAAIDLRVQDPDRAR